MSDCSSNWKLPKEFPAEVKKRKDGRYDLRVGKRHILLTEWEADCILADLQIIFHERNDHG